MLKRSGASVSASSAVSTRAWASASSARIRRCSISARAIGLENRRSGRRKSDRALPPPSAGSLVLGQILGGLAGSVAGARLRQGQRELGRLEQRARNSRVGRALELER